MTGDLTPKIAGVAFDLPDFGEVLSCILEWRRDDKPGYITLTNPHSVMLCRCDPEMAAATAGAGLTLPDGAGIILAARLLGMEPKGRVPGPELMLYLCDMGREHNLSHFFYGGAEGVAEKLAANMSARYPGCKIAGTLCPPFRQQSAEEQMAEAGLINAVKPDILWVGLGAPKQEKWMAAHLGAVKAAAIIGVGAAFDFHSGGIRRAPTVLRGLGLEWLWRFLLEPGRMAGRMADSFVFLRLVIRQLFHNKFPRFF